VCSNGLKLKRHVICKSYLASTYDKLQWLNKVLFRDYHNHKVVSCPVEGCTDSYVELQESAERKVVTMAAETIPYAHPCKGSVHIKAPPTLRLTPIKSFATRTDFIAAKRTKNGCCDIFVTSRSHQLHSPRHATAGDAIICTPALL